MSATNADIVKAINALNVQQQQVVAVVKALSDNTAKLNALQTERDTYGQALIDLNTALANALPKQ